MDFNEIMLQLNDLFINLFEDESIVLNAATTSADIDAWDSLNHIHMITAIEKKYGIRFELEELLNFSDVGDLCRGIQDKLKD